jgi:hypothetical protein
MNNYDRNGEYNNIDWKKLTNQLLTQDGISITTDPLKWNLNTSGYLEIYKMWQSANFNSSAIKWINYYPNKHFHQSIIDNISDHLKIKHIRSWISRIDPGYFAPWHWDVDDNEQEYLSNGKIQRYSIFIEPPTFGHIFILGNDYLINESLGSIIQWNNHREWHSGINAGMVPKFMLHILGNQSS